MIPRAVAETMAGTDRLVVSGGLRRSEVADCTVFRGVGKKEHVFNVRVGVSSDHAAETAYAAIAPGLASGQGKPLSPDEGYGIVGKGGTAGTKGRNGFAIGSYGTVLLTVSVWHDAAGREPDVDARALLSLLGPKLAPEWPKPPAGIDPLNPTSAPPGVEPIKR